MDLQANHTSGVECKGYFRYRIERIEMILQSLQLGPGVNGTRISHTLFVHHVIPVLPVAIAPSLLPDRDDCVFTWGRLSVYLYDQKKQNE